MREMARWAVETIGLRTGVSAHRPPAKTPGGRRGRVCLADQTNKTGTDESGRKNYFNPTVCSIWCENDGDARLTAADGAKRIGPTSRNVVRFLIGDRAS